MKQPDEICSLIKKELTDELEFKDNISDEELEHRIFEKISIYGRKEYISHSDRMLIGKKILNSMRKLDILQELIDDNSITEIMINGPADIFIERNGRIYKSEKRFESEEKLRDIITQIVSECNRVVNDVVGKLKSEVDCCILDQSVSRIHAKIEKQNGKLFIKDMNSTNGTEIDGEKIRVGELLEIGTETKILLGNVSIRIV